MSLARLATLSFTSILLMSRVAFAQATATTGPSADSQLNPSWTASSGVNYTLFPTGDIFPAYVADPHRPTNAIVTRFYSREGIPNTRSPRTWLSAGGRFGMLRIDTAGRGQRSWQVSIDAGLDAMFDSQNKADDIGWDGNYGVTVTTGSKAPWTFKVAILHVSAHLGDELSERTGLDRINYTREELALGAAWRFASAFRLYADLADAYIKRDDDQKPWRLQAGIEYESLPRLWGGRFSWFSAADFQSWQERNWRVDSSVQGGIVTRATGRTYRLLLEFLDGRPQLGQFFKYTERSLGLGFRIDL